MTAAVGRMLAVEPARTHTGLLNGIEPTNGLMQDWPLPCHKILDYAAIRVHALKVVHLAQDSRLRGGEFLLSQRRQFQLHA